MPEYELLNLTQNQLLELVQAEHLVMVPISLIEAHGPHLPLGTDLILSEQFSRRLARTLSKVRPPVNCVHFPALPFGHGGIPLPGTLSQDSIFIRKVVVELAQGIARQGWRDGVLLSAHAGREHLSVLQETVGYLRREEIFNFCFIHSKVLLQYVQEEQSPGDLIPAYDGHGGAWETSLMLSLSPNKVQGHTQIPEADNSWTHGYQGRPALASKAQGDAILRLLDKAALQILCNHFEWLCESFSKDYTGPFIHQKT